MSYILLDYKCTACGVLTESLESRTAPAPVITHTPCGADAVRIISPVTGRVKRGEVTTGKNGPPPAHALDTRPLAEGMSLTEFRTRNRAKAAKERYMAAKADFG